MIKKIQIGILAAIPLIAGILIGMTVDTIEAQMGEAGNSVIDVEEMDLVEIIETEDPETPTLKLDKITKLRASTNKMDPITHTVHYSVTSGIINLENIEVEVTSDVEQEDYLVSSLTSFKTSKNVARIKALDADSITIEVTGYSVAPPTGDERRG